MTGYKVNFKKAKIPSKINLKGKHVVLEPININNHSKDLYINFLKDKTILTTNKKFLSYAYPFKNIYDINLLNYYIHNKPLDDQPLDTTIEFFYNRFHNIKDINTVIPIFKHQRFFKIISKFKILPNFFSKKWYKRM